MNQNGNKAESSAGNFAAHDGLLQFFEVPSSESVFDALSLATSRLERGGT
jgi:hypothetical protein